MWLPFDTTHTLAEYTTISKAGIDLGSDLLRDKSWETTYLNSPHRNLLPEENECHSTDHLAKSDPLAVDITSTESSMGGFIDYIIKITVDNKHWIERAKIAALLVIHTLLRPLRASEPLKRNNPLSLIKLAGYIKLAERKNCLGWDIYTYSLRVFLPKEKQTSWVNDIKGALASTNIKIYTLE